MNADIDQVRFTMKDMKLMKKKLTSTLFKLLILSTVTLGIQGCYFSAESNDFILGEWNSNKEKTLKLLSNDLKEELIESGFSSQLGKYSYRFDKTYTSLGDSSSTQEDRINMKYIITKSNNEEIKVRLQHLDSFFFYLYEVTFTKEGDQCIKLLNTSHSKNFYEYFCRDYKT